MFPLPLFLTYVGSLTNVKNNQRRFAPTPAHITGITCPHHRNTQVHDNHAIRAGLTARIASVSDLIIFPSIGLE
jgi:hypothetical protein